MKVYVITKGSYSDYRICGVTTDIKRARQLKKIFSRGYRGYAEKASIEEYDTDYPTNEIAESNVYQIEFDKNGNISDESESPFGFYTDIDEKGYEVADKFYVDVIAKTRDDAIKIASEKRAKYMAEKFGL